MVSDGNPILYLLSVLLFGRPIRLDICNFPIQIGMVDEINRFLIGPAITSGWLLTKRFLFGRYARPKLEISTSPP
jgi:hypothetical protein